MEVRPLTQQAHLDPTIKAGIESDLRMYRRWLARLEALEQEARTIAQQYGRHTAEVSQRQRRRSDPVARAVIKLERIRGEIDDLRVRIRRVEAALEAMTDAQRTVVVGYYMDGLPRSEIEARLGVSRSEFWRIRDEAFGVYAYVAGLAQSA